MRASSFCLPFRSILLLLALALTACSATSGQFAAPRPAAPQAVQPRPAPPPTSLAAQADAAFRAKEWDKSQTLYGRILAQKGLDPEERKRALDRYSASAAEAGNPHQAVTSLEELAQLAPEVKKSFEWRRRYAMALDLSGLPQSADDHLRQTLKDGSLEWPVKAEAGRMLAGRQLGRHNYVGYVVAMEDAYGQAPDAPAKSFMEESLLLDLRQATDAALEQLILLGDPTRAPSFPQTIFLLERARRLKQMPPMAQEADRLIQRVRTSGGLVNTALLGKYDIPGAAEQAPPQATASETPILPAVTPIVPGEPVRPKQAALVLALPVTGRFAAVSAEILRGAKAAQAGLARSGVTVQLEVVNTDQPDWPDKLAALPPEYAVVGGPLRNDFLPPLVERQLLRQRAFFTFLPTLGDLREGADAWRFFGSPEDQMRGVVELAVRDLGLRRLGVLYPQERFGQRMTELFAREAALQGASVVLQEAYPPGDKTHTAKLVAKASAAKPEAVFIADSYAQAQLILPHFFMQDAHGMLFLGPDLWSQTLGAGDVKADDIDFEYLKNAAMPAAWRPGEQTAETQILHRLLEEQDGRKGGFWTALGYDFVRFAARLNLVPGAQPADVNRLLPAAALGLEWAMAPIAWDAQGVARQSMHLVSAVRGGLIPIRPEELKNRLQTARPGQ